MSLVFSGTANSSINVLANILQDYQASLANSVSGSSGAASTSGSITSTNVNNEAYILDLSQAAQDILNSQSSSGVSSKISLSDTQKQKLDGILAKYKDSPVNSDTLNSLNADLQQAGLAPQELAVIQQAKDFNPLQNFLNALLGASSGSGYSYNSDNVLSGLSLPSSNSPLGQLAQQKVSGYTTPSLSNILQQGSSDSNSYVSSPSLSAAIERLLQKNGTDSSGSTGV